MQTCCPQPQRFWFLGSRGGPRIFILNRTPGDSEDHCSGSHEIFWKFFNIRCLALILGSQIPNTRGLSPCPTFASGESKRQLAGPPVLPVPCLIHMGHFLWAGERLGDNLTWEKLPFSSWLLGCVQLSVSFAEMMTCILCAFLSLLWPLQVRPAHNRWCSGLPHPLTDPMSLGRHPHTFGCWSAVTMEL